MSILFFILLAQNQNSMKKLYVFLLLLVHLPAISQTTMLLSNADPAGGAEIAGRTVFITNSGQFGSTDGTPGGTILIPTSTVMYTGSDNVALLNGKIVVAASSAAAGLELWISDGTIAGTTLLKDIYPGSADGDPYSNAGNFNVVNGILYFTANDGVNGRELWKTDGTSAGTVMVKDINPGASGSSVNFPVPIGSESMGNTLFFTVNNVTNGTELWKTDGTNAGTVMVKDINPGAASTTFSKMFLGNGTHVFFIANDGTNGWELWRTDGTSGGTIIMQNISPGSGNAFLLNSSGDRDWEGFIFNNQLYFSPNSITGNQLWVSNGTSGGTSLITSLATSGSSSVQLSQSIIKGSKFYFTGFGNTAGSEVWGTDGTALGTTVLKDINPGSNGSNPQLLVPRDNFDKDVQFIMQGKFFFLADNGSNGREIWVSDGTGAGTVMLKDINPGVANGFPTSGGYDYYRHTGYKFFFVSDNGVNGNELWQTDGTAVGTTMVQDMWPGLTSSNIEIHGIATANNKLIFQANDGNGTDIYALNATVVHLPLTLLSFSAQLKSAEILLNWTTQNEVNVSHFNVQRSITGKEFSTITRVNATTGSQNQNNYGVTDVNYGKSGILYYRLEVVDKDGKLSYSKIQTIKLRSEFDFNVSSSKNETLISMGDASGVASVKITDGSARILTQLKQKIAAGEVIRLSTINLASGIYYVTVELNGNVQTKRFVK